jgi:hypothetical protein
MTIMFHDIFLYTAAGCRRNPPQLAVFLPSAAGVSPTSAGLGSKDTSTVPNGTVDLPATVIGKDGKERGATKPKTRTTKSSTSANLAISNAAGSNNRLKPSLYTLPAVKTGISEAATAYNQKIGGLSLRVGQLFPVCEAPA